MMLKKIIIPIYSFLQRITGFNKFGKNSIIKHNYKIWNKACLSIGNNVFIAEGSFFAISKRFLDNNFSPLVKIGNNVCIGKNLMIACIDEITIEDNVLCSDNVFIADHIHGYEDVTKPVICQPLLPRGKVTIKEGAFVGINCVIMPGVTIGINSVIGASSVVTKNIPDYCVAAGNPATIIKRYDFTKKEWLNVKGKEV